MWFTEHHSCTFGTVIVPGMGCCYCYTGISYFEDYCTAKNWSWMASQCEVSALWLCVWKSVLESYMTFGIVCWVVLWIILGVILSGAMLLIHGLYAHLHLIVTLVLKNLVSNLQKWITSHNLNKSICEGDQSSSVSRDPSSVIYLLSSTTSHPPPVGHPNLVTIHILSQFITGLDISLVIHLWPQSVSGHDSSQAVSHLVMLCHSLAICFHPVGNCACMVCIPNFSCLSLCSLKLIFTNLHNVCLPCNNSCH